MKKLLTILAALMMSVMLHAQTATAPSAGDGTVGNPYQIATLENLYWIRATPAVWGRQFIQTADIEAHETAIWFEGKGWIPIGFGDGGADQFRGHYDGQGHVIYGLNIYRQDITGSRAGLFGVTFEATIKNLGLINANIRAGSYVGALVGENYAGSIVENCFSTGIVQGGHAVGGLVGFNSHNSSVRNSYSTSNVTGNNYTGGLVGHAFSNSTIDRSYATGNVTAGGERVGGFIGNLSGGATVYNSYATGRVTGGERVGGFAGRLNGSTLQRCYAVGEVISSGTEVGGFLGSMDSWSSSSYNYWDIETSGQSSSAAPGDWGRSTVDMKSFRTYYLRTWDFNDTWGINPAHNNGYPFLAWQGYVHLTYPVVQTSIVTNKTTISATSGGNFVLLGSPNPTQHGVCWNTSGNPTIADFKTEQGAVSELGAYVSNLTGLQPSTTYYVRAYAINAHGVVYGNLVSFFTNPSGEGTEGNPYIIPNLSALKWIMDNPEHWDKHYTQTANIDALPTITWTNDPAIPIGNITNKFTGFYKGNGHSIDGLYFYRWNVDYLGLFGYTLNATIENLTLSNVNYRGRNYTGGLVGYAESTIIENCSTSGTIEGNSYLGGLVGQNAANSVINNCHSTSVAKGISSVGGLVGVNANLISNSSASGLVTGFSSVGGLVGFNNINSSVTSSFANGQALGNNNFVGGLIGTNSGTLNNVYATGNANGLGSVGGLIGKNNASGVVSLAYSTGTASGTSSMVGGFIGENAGNTSNNYSNGDANGTSSVGGFIGKNNSTGIVRISYSIGTATGTSSMTGGFIGENLGNVSNNYSIGNAIGSTSVGGMIGENSGNVSNNYSNGNADGTSSIGGFVGKNNASGSINFCYSIGIPQGVSLIGGLIGENLGNTSNSFWNTTYSGVGSSDGGTGINVSQMQQFMTFFSAGWDFIEETANGNQDYWGINSTDNGGFPFLVWQNYEHFGSTIITTLPVNNISAYKAYGNGDMKGLSKPKPTQHGVCWNLTGNPTLADFKTEEGPVTEIGAFSSEITMLDALTTYYVRAYAIDHTGVIYGEEVSFTTHTEGDGSEGNPYQITNLDDLIWMTANPQTWNGHFIQTANIDASSSVTWDGGNGLSPVGNSTEIFTGTFDGQGNYINGIFINRAVNYQALFGYIDGATIKNLNITNANITGASSTAALVGHAGIGSQIINCHSSGVVNGTSVVGGLIGLLNTSDVINSNSECDVTGSAGMIGGLAGRASGSITDCFATGQVIGVDYTGGLVGYTNLILTSNSYAHGDVAGRDYVGGLLGQLWTGSSVSNSFATGNVSGQHYIGGITGDNNGSTIQSCYSSSNMTGTGRRVGGLAGRNQASGIITNSYALGNVTGLEYVGGVTGHNITGAVVSYCYSIGFMTLTGPWFMGGLVGYNDGGTVTQSFWDKETSGITVSSGSTNDFGKTTIEMKKYATFFSANWDFANESANGTNDYWGINNWENDGYPFLIWQGYDHIIPIEISTLPISAISGTNATVNGSIDYLGSSNIIQHGFTWSTNGVPIIDNDSFNQMGPISELATFSFEITGLERITEIFYRAYASTADGKIYYGSLLEFTTAMDGEGTEFVPYIISNLDELKWIMDHPAAWSYYYIQTANIDATSTQSWDGGFSPIGNLTTKFSGHYDGQGHSIDNLYINRPSINNQGLFGYTENASIKNLTINNLNYTAGTSFGGIVGRPDYTTIENCTTSGVLNGFGSGGGIAGYAAFTTIINCHSSVDVSGNSGLGGNVGSLQNSNISNSSASGNVSGGHSNVGGLAGSSTTSSTIDRCFATGNVTAINNNVGGLVGYNTSPVRNSYAKGNVTGTSIAENIGGLVGMTTTTSIINSYSIGEVSSAAGLYVGGLIGRSNPTNVTGINFWNITTSGQTTTAGNADGTKIFGKTTAEMKTRLTFTAQNWDFLDETANGTNNFWGMNSWDNDGYPFLAWQGYPNEGPAQISTLAATEVSSISAQLNANLIVLGFPFPVSYGFCWNSTGNPNIQNDSNIELGVPEEIGGFSYLLEGLDPSSPYYFRAYVVGMDGLIYGNEILFYTNPTGDGTSVTPFEITALHDLEWLINNPIHWDKSFIQTANIDASPTSTWIGGGFVPIGNLTTQFAGTYNGQGYIINGLSINRPAGQYQGMFGYLNGADIKNITLEGFQYHSGGANSGGLVGRSDNSQITNCAASGTLTGAGANSGGLIGYASLNTIVYSCYANAIITKATYSGGLVGYLTASNISNSYASSSVTGTDYVGGLAGHISGSAINNCYASGAVAGNTFLGGITGQAATSTFNNVFWDKENSGQLTSAGGVNVIGMTTENMKFFNTYFHAGWDFIDENINGVEDFWGINSLDNDGYPFLHFQGFVNAIPSLVVNTYAATLVAETTATANGKVFVLGSSVSQHGFTWNTTGTPNINDDVFSQNGTLSETSLISSEISSLNNYTEYFVRAYATDVNGTVYGEQISFTTEGAPDGTVDNPYQIATLVDLRWISNNISLWDKHFIQVSNIDASATNTGFGFLPIGNGSTEFTGSYNGQGYTIDGLFINRISAQYIGLFGRTNAATIKNVNLTNVNIKGFQHTGGLIGYAFSSTVTSCTTSGSVHGTSDNVGGLIGLTTWHTLISDCHSSASVSGDLNNIGGLVGNNGRVIQFSSATGNVTGTALGNGSHNVGGFVGWNNGLSSEIRNCFATGAVSGTKFVGGLVGYMYRNAVRNSYARGNVIAIGWNGYHEAIGGLVGGAGNHTINIEKSYSTGTVTLTAGYIPVGGSIGNYTGSSLPNGFWDTESSGVLTGVAISGTANVSGIIGRNTAQMTTQANFTDSGWDFVGETTNGTNNHWNIHPSANDGYPHLNWQDYGLPYDPDVTTQGMTEISATSAMANGNIASIGNPEADMHGFCWNTTGNPNIIDDNLIAIGVPLSTGPFSFELNDLIPNTTYFIKAFASNSEGAHYGSEISFTTTRQELSIGGYFNVSDKVYDGNNTAEISETHFDLFGLIAGYSNVSLANVVVVFDQVNTGLNISVSILSTELQGADMDLYQLSLVGAPSTTANIDQKELFVSGAVADNKVYDGNTLTGISNAVLVGVVGSEFIELDQLIGYFTDKNVGNSKTVTADITLLGDLNGNYFFTQPSGLSANITAKELSVINAQASSKEYDSTTDAVIADAVLTGMVGDEEVTLLNQTIGTFTQANVGAEISVIADMTIDGLDATNYTIIQPDYLKADITPKELIVINAVALDKTYDGTNAAVITGAELTGIIGSDIVILENNTTGLFSQIGIGANISVITSMTIAGDDAGNYTLTQPILTADITAKELTVSGTFDVADKVYNSSLNAVISNNNLLINGIVTPDNVFINEVDVAFASKNVGNNIPVNITIFTIGGDVANYTLSLDNLPSGIGNITPAPLNVINALAHNKIYDGTTAAVITNAELSGFYAGDVVVLGNNTVGSFEQDGIGNNIPVITNMTISGANHSNYSLIQPTLSANITPKPLTITASSFNKTTGVEYVFVGDEFFTSDIIDGDEVTSVTLTSDGAASTAVVGPYNIIPSNAVGVGLANYTVSYANGTLTVVDQTEVTLTGIIASNKVYDGTTLAEITNWGTLLDVADGDVVTLDTSSAIATFNNKNVGNNKVVTITGLALSGVDADKYYINNHFSNADITAKDLILSGFYADDKVYDGDVLAINHGFDDDRIIGDVLLYSYNAAFEDKNAGENKTIIFTDIQITGGADMNNYNLTVTSGSGSASIFTREVIVLNAQALDKDYDGFTNAEVFNAELFNHIATDDVILEDHFFGFFAQADVGLNIPIETQMSLSGIDALNYDLIQPDYLVADISQKVLEVINAAANNKVYDATTDAEIVGAELSGVVSGDVVSLNNETIGEFAQAGVGVEINVTSFMMISGDDAGNYHLVQPALFADITHKEVTVGGSFAVSDKVYDGNNIAALSENLLLIEGVIAPDAIAIESVEIAFSDINVGVNVMVNITNLTITGNTENYILSLDNTPVAYANITPAQLTVINAIAQDKVYDKTAAAVITGAELAGVIGDDIVVLGNNTIGTFAQVNVGADINVLSSMTISGADSDNYELVQPLLTASITAKPLTITAQSFLKSLGTEYVFEGDEFFAGEMIAGDDVTSVTLTSDGAAIDAIEGDYDIIPSDAVGVGIGNYDISYVNGTLSVVDQAELILSGLVIYDKVYDGNNIAQVANWGALTPVADGDDVSLDFSNAAVTFANKLVGNNKIVSITGLALSGANADNYFINNHFSQASITARTLVLSNFTADDKEYDATTAATGTSFEDDRVAGDVLTLTYDASFADKTAGQDKDVNYTNILIVSGADMNNYVLVSTSGTAYADITPKALTISGSFTALDKEYDGTTTATIDENNLYLVGVITDDVVTLNAVAEFVSPIVANNVEVNLLISTITGTDALNYELSFVAAPTTTANITAPPVVYYTLTITIVGSGTVEVDGELYTTEVTVEEGTILDLEAIAAEGWEFSNWTGDVASASSAITTITVDEDKEVSATFTIIDNIVEITSEIAVYPNPFKNTININSLEGIASIKVINIIGQVITEIDVENFTTATINTRELPNGVYFISIKDSTGNTHTKKVVKE